MRQRKHLHAVECKCELEIHGLFGPQRAVVVEDRHTLGLGPMVGMGGVGHPVDEGHDGCLRRAVVP